MMRALSTVPARLKSSVSSVSRFDMEGFPRRACDP
jgi:hypothetical protein